MRNPIQPLIASSVAAASFSAADTLPLVLQGNTSADVWGAGSLTSASNPNFPGALNFAQPWPSSIPTSNGGDSFLTKTANGPTGAPIPSGQSIYFVSFANAPNTFGGSLAVNDATPVANLSTLAFQIEIGGANGYDLHNNDLAQPPDLSTVKLHYTTTGGATGTLTSNSQSLLDRYYTFAIDMPVGPNGEDLPVDIYNRLYGLQWDVSGIPDIASFNIEFSGVEHAQLYQLRLDQSDHVYGNGSVFPADAVWTAAGPDTSWQTNTNWQGDIIPNSGRNIRIAIGNEAVSASPLDSRSLTIATPSAFALRSPNSSALNLTSGINASSPGTVAHQIEVPVHLTKYGLFDVAAGNTLVFTNSLTGSGFYKQGPGNLLVTGNNHFEANSSLQSNGLIFSGGENILTGSTTFSGIPSATFNIRPDTTVRLTGATPPVDPKFIANLLGSTSRLILGDANSPTPQTFHSLAGSVTNVPVTGSKVLGGSPEISVLTLSPASGTSIFAGDIGGNGLHENNLSIIKTGSGLQVLSGNNTYTGTTTIREGILALDPTGRAIELDGGVLAIQGTDLSAALGASGITFTASGGFAANGIAGTSSNDPTAFQTVTLNGGASLSWNNRGFLADGEKLILSGTGTNRSVHFANSIDLGNTARHIEVADGLQETDARFTAPITGSGDLIKTGPGFLDLAAANTATGTLVHHDGIVAISGTDGTFAGNLAARPGSFLRITNTAAANRNNRLSTTSGVTLSGGFITFTAASTGNTETAGTLSILEGANTVSTNRSPAGTSTIFTFSDLVRASTSIVNFSGSSVGLSDARNQVLFTTPPALTHGIVGGWAVTGNEFATYGAHGITAYAAYSTAAESAWTSSDNIKLTAGAATAPTAVLTGSRTIHSLRLVGATSNDVGNILDLSGNTLSVQSGGILTNGGSDTRTTKIRDGILTAPEELLITSNGIAEITATIADPSPGTPLTLVKSGSQILSLLSPATHTGPTVVNQGVLRLGPASSLVSAIIDVKDGGTLRVTDLTEPYEIPTGRTVKGIGTIQGNIISRGIIAPTASAQTPLIFSGNLTTSTDSEIRITIEPSSALTISSSLQCTGEIDIATGTRLVIQTTAAPSGYWGKARSFRIASAASFAGDYSATRPLGIESDLTGGVWDINYDESSISILWTPLGPLRQWRSDHFEGLTSNTGDAADHADPDGDSIVNLIEYALGSDPNSHDPSTAPAFDPASGFSFSIPSDPPADLTYEIQISDDLASWRPLASLAPGATWLWHGQGVSTLSLTTSSGKSHVSISDDDPASPPARRFMRLKVSYPQIP